MYKGRKIAAVVPAFNEEKHIAGVIRTAPEYVDYVVVVNDCSTDGTSAAARRAAGRQLGRRVFVIDHAENQGVGGSIMTAHRKALSLGADICVVLAGDAQCPPQIAHRLIDAVIEGADYAKGNRFYGEGSLGRMPFHRVFGNFILSFLNHPVTGYWHVFDPQQGYTAISRGALRRLDLGRIAKRYYFENDMLAHLNVINARVVDVPTRPIYAAENSKIRVGSYMISTSLRLARTFVWRMWEKHAARNRDPGIIGEFLLGLAILLAAVAYPFVAAFASSCVGPFELLYAVLLAAAGFAMLTHSLFLDYYKTCS